MATADITVYKSTWTEVVPSGGAGLFSSNAGAKVYVRQAASQPDDSVLFGHPLENDKSINVDLSAGTDILYARLNPIGIQKEGLTCFTSSS